MLAKAGQRHREPQRDHGGGHVDVEDLLRQPLVGLHGRVPERQHHHDGHPGQGQHGQHECRG